MKSEQDSKSNSLKQFDKGNYLNREETLELLATVPIPEEKKRSEKPRKSRKSKSGVPSIGNSPRDDNSFMDLEHRMIDLNTDYHGNIHTQDQWIAYLNFKKQIMVSMPDLYFAGKSNNQVLLASLRKDLKKDKIITSTRIIYEDKTNALIIHDYGSKIVLPVGCTIVIPDYAHTKLNTVLNTKAGLNYLQTLFYTKDDAKKIKQTLENLSGYTSNNILLTTPEPPTKKDLGTRFSYPHRAAGFVSINNIFHVSGNAPLFESSRSYGVSLSNSQVSQKSGSIK